MSRTQQALRLAFADYPICSKLGRRMGDQEAAQAFGISKSAVSHQVGKQRKKYKDYCDKCGKKY